MRYVDHCTIDNWQEKHRAVRLGQGAYEVAGAVHMQQVVRIPTDFSLRPFPVQCHKKRSFCTRRSLSPTARLVIPFFFVLSTIPDFRPQP
jgi:hypothetical protein